MTVIAKFVWFLLIYTLTLTRSSIRKSTMNNCKTNYNLNKLTKRVGKCILTYLILKTYVSRIEQMLRQKYMKGKNILTGSALFAT